MADRRSTNYNQHRDGELMAQTKRNVDFKSHEYNANVNTWAFVNDICDSKNLGKYLVKLNPDDKSKENATRNDQFRRRAIFYAVAGYTSRGLVGKAFSKPPVTDVPPNMEYVKNDIDGMGTTIDQQAQDVTRDVLRIGRSGLMADFPESDGELSVAQLASGGIFATVTKFDAHQIINVQTKKIGARTLTSKIVLALKAKMEGPDGFSFDEVDVRLELRLDSLGELGEVYSMVEWRKNPAPTNDDNEWLVVGTTVPKDAQGAFLEEIPFVFVGSESNTHKIDPAPMKDIAEINKGHFNNSAIYEDSVFTVGQAQPWMSGITQSHIDLMKKNNMYVGSSWLMGVPSGEKMGFAQVEPNTLAREAMNDKVQMMIGLGAMFITPGSANKTATQSEGELLAQHSVLSLGTSNVSDAYTKALGFVALFMGSDPAAASYEITKDFVSPTADANMLREIAASFLQGLLPVSDLLAWQQKHGLVDSEKTLEEYQEEIGGNDTGLDLDAN